MVSLGTGQPPVVDLKEIDVFRPDSIWDTTKVVYGISTISKKHLNKLLTWFYLTDFVFLLFSLRRHPNG